MGRPVEVLHTDLELNGDEGCFEIPFPNRVFIDTITVVRIDGAGTEFTADLFSRREACLSSQISESVGGEELPEDLFRVVAAMNSSGGVIAQFLRPGISYVNQDVADASKPPALQKYFIYLRIRPAATGAFRYAIRIKGTSDFI